MPAAHYQQGVVYRQPGPPSFPPQPLTSAALAAAAVQQSVLLKQSSYISFAFVSPAPDTHDLHFVQRCLPGLFPMPHIGIGLYPGRTLCRGHHLLPPPTSLRDIGTGLPWLPPRHTRRNTRGCATLPSQRRWWTQAIITATSSIAQSTAMPLHGARAAARVG